MIIVCEQRPRRIGACYCSLLMILLIDNYDSFTWNLVQRLGELDRTLEPGRDLIVLRHDEIRPSEAEQLNDGRGPTHVIISPGPCTPKEAGISGQMIDHFAGRIPILGVCLGHQCMADNHGMVVERHPLLMHGKTSSIAHDGRGIFEGVSTPTTVARYHSLVVRRDSVPALQPGEDGWEVSASCFDEIGGEEVEVVMGLRRVWADTSMQSLEGVQFHPESFMTPEGVLMLWNFLRTGPGGREVARPEPSAEFHC
jgi:anthranilate synthase/aminodeoxychorismate synthase-like glutamine amidotransferase